MQTEGRRDVGAGTASVVPHRLFRVLDEEVLKSPAAFRQPGRPQPLGPPGSSPPGPVSRTRSAGNTSVRRPYAAENGEAAAGTAGAGANAGMAMGGPPIEINNR